MKFVKTARLLLQRKLLLPKLTSSQLEINGPLTELRLSPTSHPAIRSFFHSSSYCSCCSLPITLVDSFSYRTLSYNPVLAPQDFVSSRQFYANHGNCRQFWSRSKSTEAGEKESSKEEISKGSDDIPEEKMSLYQRFKHMYKNYWYVLIPVHVVTSIGWGGMFYYIASSGIDIPAFLESVGATQKIIDMMRNSQTGYVAVAYTMYKIATPVRYSVTLGGTTMTIKHLVRHGLIKPVDSKKIQQMYSETKDQFMEKRDTFKENMMEKKDRMLSQMADVKKELSKQNKK
nr:PREDICTED: uncharacterized protein C18orf19 homolog A [Bemisia tabaci]